MPTYLHVPPIGINEQDGFNYRSDRPAQHCKLCGASYQPVEARSPNYGALPQLRLQVQYLLREWAFYHNKTHSEKEHLDHIRSGRLLTPEAAIKLIPLGIYPVDDLHADAEIRQAGLEAPRAPINDVPTK